MNHSLEQQVFLYQVILSNSTLVYIFLIYNHSKQEMDHSLQQQVYLYQVEYSYCSLGYIFLIYNPLKQEKDHSIKQQVYLYQVILSIFYISLYLPNLKSFKTGEESFSETTSLFISSNSIKCYFRIYIFLNQNYSLQKINLSSQQQVYLYQVILSMCFIYKDVPFKNGKCSLGRNSLKQLKEIHSDEGNSIIILSFFSIFQIGQKNQT